MKASDTRLPAKNRSGLTLIELVTLARVALRMVTQKVASGSIRPLFRQGNGRQMANHLD